MLHWVLIVACCAIAVVSLWKRCFSNATYATFMVAQCITYVRTNSVLLVVAVFVTLLALLLTRNEE